MINRIVSTAFLFLLPTTFAAGSPLASADEVAIPLSQRAVKIFFSDLKVNDAHPDGEIRLGQGPVHGTLSETEDHFLYTPRDSFWSVEVDALTYTFTDASGSSEATVALYVPQYLEASPPRVETFEDPAILHGANNYVVTTTGQSAIGLKSLAQLEGQTGIEFTSDAGHAFLTIPGTDPGTGGATGGGARGGFGCIPPDQGGNGGGLVGGTLLIAIGGDPLNVHNPPQIRLVTDGTNRVVLEAHTLAGWVASKALDLEGDRAFVEIEWQEVGTQVHNLLLRIDGKAVRLFNVAGLNLSSPSIHIGLIPLTHDPDAVAVTLGFDDLYVYETTDDLAPSPVHAMDDFEQGSTDGWDTYVGMGLNVTAGAAAAGDFGLEAAATSPSYLVAESPGLTSRLSARMRVDFSEYFTTWGDMSTIYAFGFNPAATNLHTIMRMRLYGGQSNEPRLVTTFANATTAGTTWSNTVAVSGENTLTMQYRAATSNLHPNGYLRIWRGDDIIIQLDDLDSFEREADWNHFGLYGTDPGTAGYIKFDDFISIGR